MRKINFRVFTLTFLFSSLSLAPLANAQSTSRDYWFCDYGANLSDYYMSGVFKSPYRGTKILEKLDLFHKAVIAEFGRDPKIPLDRKPSCSSFQTQKEAETNLEKRTKAFVGFTPPDVNVYSTQWTPTGGIKNNKPYIRP